MAKKGIIVDIGFKADVQDFVSNIQKEFKKIDFDNIIGLSESFDKQEKEVKQKLKDLAKVIDETINGKIPNDPSKQLQALNKAVNMLSVSMKDMIKSMPAEQSNKLANTVGGITDTINELVGVCGNATSAIKEVSDASNGGVQFVDKKQINQQMAELENLFKMMKKTVDEVTSLNDASPKNQSGKTPYKNVESVLKDLTSMYGRMYEAQDKWINATNSETVDIDNIDKATQSYLQCSNAVLRLLSSYEKLGGDSAEEIDLGDDLVMPISEIRSDVGNDFDDLRSYINKRINEINTLYQGLGGDNLFNKFSKSMKKEDNSDKITIPLSISTSATDLRNQALTLIKATQDKLKDNPLKVELMLVSEWKTKKNRERLEEIKSQLANVNDKTVKSKLLKLTDDIQGTIDDALTLDVRINTEPAFIAIRNFIADAKSELKTLSEELIPLEPEVVLTDEHRAAFQKQLDEAKGDFKIQVGIMDGEDTIDQNATKKELSYLKLLREKVEAVEKAVNDKSLAFIDEDKIVNEVVTNESGYLNHLYGDLISIEEQIKDISNAFESIPKNISIDFDLSSIKNLDTEALTKIENAKDVINEVNKKISSNLGFSLDIPEDQVSNLVSDIGKLKGQIDNIFTTSSMKSWKEEFVQSLTEVSNKISNLFGNNALNDMIKEWQFSDELMKKAKGNDHVRERVASIASDGKIYGSGTYDQHISTNMRWYIQEELKKMGLTQKVGIHSHGSDRIATSSIPQDSGKNIGGADLGARYSNYINDAVEKQLTIALNDIELFDAKGFFDSNSSIDFNSDEIKVKIRDKKNEIQKQISQNFYEYFEKFISDYGTKDVFGFKENLFNEGSKNLSINSALITDYIKENINAEDIAKNFFNDAKTSSDLNTTLGESIKETIHKSFSGSAEIIDGIKQKYNIDIDKNEINETIMNFQNYVSRYANDIINNSFKIGDFDYGTSGRDMWTYNFRQNNPKILEEALKGTGYKNNYQDYMKSYTTDEFIKQNPLGLSSSTISDMFNNAAPKDFLNTLDKIVEDFNEIKKASSDNSFKDMFNIKFDKESLVEFNNSVDKLFDSLKQIPDLLKSIYSNDLFKNGASSNSREEYILKLKDSIKSIEDITGETFIGVVNNLDKLDSDMKQKVSSILQEVKLIDSEGNFLFKQSSGGNSKALISDGFVILQKAISNNVDEMNSFISKIKEAKNEGINLAEVYSYSFSNVPSQFSNGYTGGYEIQEKAKGTELHQTQKSLKSLENSIYENENLLNATKEQLSKFVQDWIALDRMGLQIDPSKSSNFLYDIQNGFQFIDLSLKNVGEKAKNTESLFREIITALTDTGSVFKYNDLNLNNVSGSLATNVADIFKENGMLSKEQISKIFNENYPMWEDILKSKSFDKKKDVFTDKDKNVDSIIDGEIKKLKELEEQLGKVTDAVNSKTEAFRKEGEVVGGVVGEEVDSLNPLQNLESAYNNFKPFYDNGDLESEAGANAALTYYNSYKDALESKLNKKDIKQYTVGNMDDLFSGNYTNYKKGTEELDLSGLTSQIDKYQEIVNKLNQPEVINIINALSESIKQLLDSGNTSDKTTEFLSQLNKVINNLSNNKSAEKIQKISDNLNNFQKSLQLLNSADNNGFVQMLSSILEKGNELKSLGEVLKSTEKQIQAATKSVNGQDNYDKSSKYMIDNEDAIRKSINQKYGVNGNEVLYSTLSATKDGLVQVISLVKQADETYKKYTSTVDNNGKIQEKSINTNVMQLSKEAKQWEVFKKLQASIIPGASNLGKEGETFTPDSNNWDELVSKASEFGIKVQDIEKVIRNVDEIGQESFQIFTNLSRITVGMSSNGVLFQKDDVLDTGVVDEFKKEIASLPNLLNNAFKGNSTSINVFLDLLNSIKNNWVQINSLSKKGLISKSDLTDSLNYLESFKQTLSNISLEKIDLNGKTPKFIEQYKIAEDYLNQLIPVFDKIESDQPFTDEDFIKVKQFTSQVELLFNTINEKDSKLSKDTAVNKTLIKLYDTLEKNSSMSKELKNEFNQLAAEITSFGADIPANKMDEFNSRFMKLSAQMKETGQVGKSFFDMITARIKGMSASMIAQYFSLYDIIRYVRQLINYVIELDTAMVELRKVTDGTEQQYKSFQNTIAQTAKDVASTNAELISSAADWARLGYSIEQAAELSKNSAIFVNVGDGIDITTATEDMVSAMKAFNIQAEDSMRIVDAYNEVGNNFAISASGIGEGMQRSASALATANNSFEQSIALITAMNEILQDTETAGTTLKVLSLRLRGASTEIEDMGESTDGMAESTSKLQAKIAALTNTDGSGGISILTDTGEFKSTYEIIQGIASKWQDISDVNQAALLELIAGKTRANGVAALLNNWEQLDKIVESASESEGSAAKENEAVVDSIQGKIKILKASIEELANDFISSDLVKGFVDFGTKSINILDSIINKFGSLGTVITSVLGVMAVKGIAKNGGGRARNSSLGAIRKYITSKVI